MCCSPYDYCIPAIIDREDDFRGCGPNYRAGSLFCNASCGDCGTNDITFLAANAGNFGKTIPVSAVNGEPMQPDANSTGSLPPSIPDTFEHPAIAKPPAVEKPPVKQPIDLDLNDPFSGQPLPTIDELLKKSGTEETKPPLKPKNGTPKSAKPVAVPVQPVPITPPAARTLPSSDGIDTIPFVESDAQPPVQNQFQTNPSASEPIITVDELKKLDPTATDIKILNVEDSVLAP